MEIHLNGEKLNFTLETEKNFRDIIGSIETWLGGSDMVITSLLLNDKEAGTVPHDKWNKTPISEIDKIEITAAPIQEVRLNSMHTVKQFLEMLQDGVNKGNRQLLGELQTGHPYMLSTIRHLFSPQTPVKTDEVNLFLAAFSNLDLSSVPDLDPAVQEQVCSLAAGVVRRINGLLRTESDPAAGLQDIITSLHLSIDEISEVSVLLQTGKDKEAMASIIKFTDQLQKLQDVFLLLRTRTDIHLAEKKIAGQSPEFFYNELNTILKELIEAFSIKDYVLIGDLLEYEIAPRLEEMIKFIEECKREMEKNVS